MRLEVTNRKSVADGCPVDNIRRSLSGLKATGQPSCVHVDLSGIPDLGGLSATRALGIPALQKTFRAPLHLGREHRSLVLLLSIHVQIPGQMDVRFTLITKLMYS